MVHLSTLEEWQKQSALLLQARPMTARVTTKYNILNLSSQKPPKPHRKEQEDKEETDKDGTSQQRVAKATITLKTYDPESGITLKFETDRAADVGRTIAGLGSLGRHMAALPPKAEVTEVAMEDPVAEPAKMTATNTIADAKTPAQTANTGGTSKKKKKKGKK